MVTGPAQMVGRGQSGWPGSDDEHPFAAVDGLHRQLPALLQCHVAQEPFDGLMPTG